MTESVLYLSLAYAGLGVVVLGLNVYSRWPLWVKLSAIVAVTGLYFVTWQALAGMYGWPARQPLPERFMLLSSSVHEPNNVTGEPGAIHLWIVPITADDRPLRRPRAFVLPYSQTLHNEVDEARRRMRNGYLQIGMTSSGPGLRRGADVLDFARMAQHIEFENLPDPILPEK